VIELREVSRRFGERTAVDRVSLEAARGECLVLVGGSGSGKTTTLKMVNRLVEPSAGEIRVDGADVRSVAPHALRRRIGYAFQQVGLFPHLTVAENVGVTPELLGWDAARVCARVDELLELVELPPAEFRGRSPAELSGGQQQRVGLARALAAGARILLLDEPFGALDPLTRDRLQQWFQRVRRELELTVLFVTHDMAEALLLGDRVGVMNAGRLVQLGPPRELLLRPADDYVAELLSAPRRQTEAVEALLGGNGRGGAPGGGGGGAGASGGGGGPAGRAQAGCGAGASGGGA
jgi:osmoprotectant transport system ATP-binding protein